MRPIDNDDIVTFDQKCADFAQMLLSDHPRSFEFRRRAQYGKTKWIAGNKAVKHRLVELIQIVDNVRKRILMTQTQITGRVTESISRSTSTVDLFSRAQSAAKFRAAVVVPMPPLTPTKVYIRPSC